MFETGFGYNIETLRRVSRSTPAVLLVPAQRRIGLCRPH